MEKILFVTDTDNINSKSLDFAAFLCELSHSKLTGVFLKHEPTYATADVSYEDNSLRFTASCERRGIKSAIHRDCGIPHDEIIAESRYADLLLIDVATTSSTDQREDIPTDFVRDILVDAECPVVIMPVAFDGIEQLVFTFDGQPSSVYAIKQFTYLFPELKDQQVVVISINEEEIMPDQEERYKLKEWLHMHYKNIDFLRARGNVKAGLVELLLSRSRAFIVMGAYGRSAFSNLFNPSHANSILKMVSQPVFIAHH
jgi:hypothetical protein